MNNSNSVANDMMMLTQSLFVMLASLALFACATPPSAPPPDAPLSVVTPHATPTPPSARPPRGRARRAAQTPIVITEEDLAKLAPAKDEIAEQIFRTTAYKSSLVPEPDNPTELIRIPKNTKLTVLEKMLVTQGETINSWYRVEYEGFMGWVSGWNMKEKEELRLITIGTMDQGVPHQGVCTNCHRLP